MRIYNISFFFVQVPEKVMMKFKEFELTHNTVASIEKARIDNLPTEKKLTYRVQIDVHPVVVEVFIKFCDQIGFKFE